MQIDVQSGSDTGLSLVEVYLESAEECALSNSEFWAMLNPLLASRGVHAGDVVDFFLYRRGLDGEWESAGQIPWEIK